MREQKSSLYPVWSILAVLSLLLGACAPAAPAPTPKPAPVPTVAPAAASPIPKPAAEEPRRGGVLTLAIGGDIPTFDPHTSTAGMLGHAALSSYSNLVQFDMEDLTDTRIIGDLATKWEVNPEGTAYTFYLHQDAKFHDGQPVTAEDVKSSLERIAFPPKGVPSNKKEDLGAVQNIEMMDKYTLKITLKYPSASFMPFIAGPWIVILPKHLLEKEGQDALRKRPLGSGPFMMKEYVRGISYEAVRNSNYYKPGLPYLDGIQAFVIKDVQAYMAALRTGRVMMLRRASAPLNPAQREVLLKHMGDGIVSEVGAVLESVSFFTPNNNWKPFTDARVRRAVAMGLYKQGYFDIVFQGLGQVSGPMPARGTWGLPKAELETYPGYEPDMKARIAKAKQLLAEAGYPDGFEMAVSTRSDVSYYFRGMEYVVSELPKIGIRAKAKPMEQGAYFAEVEKASFQGAFGNHGVSTGDPDSIIGTFFITQGSRNYAHHSDPRVDELFEKQRRTLDPQQRKELVWEIQRILLREAYWPVFGQIPQISAWLKKVKGNIDTNAQFHNVKYEDVWLAE